MSAEPLALPSQIASESLRRLFEYWQALRGERFAPSWREIDPGAIKSLLPHILMVELEQDPLDVRFRFVGSTIMEAYGEDFMGRKLRSLDLTGGIDLWLSIYARLAETKLPCYGRYSLSSDYVRTQYVDAGIFPLSSDGERVDRTIELEDWSEAVALAPSALMHPAWRFDPF